MDMSKSPVDESAWPSLRAVRFALLMAGITGASALSASSVDVQARAKLRMLSERLTGRTDELASAGMSGPLLNLGRSLGCSALM